MPVESQVIHKKNFPERSVHLGIEEKLK